MRRPIVRNAVYEQLSVRCDVSSDDIATCHTVVLVAGFCEMKKSVLTPRLWEVSLALGGDIRNYAGSGQSPYREAGDVDLFYTGANTALRSPGGQL